VNYIRSMKNVIHVPHPIDEECLNRVIESDNWQKRVITPPQLTTKEKNEILYGKPELNVTDGRRHGKRHYMEVYAVEFLKQHKSVEIIGASVDMNYWKSIFNQAGFEVTAEPIINGRDGYAYLDSRRFKSLTQGYKFTRINFTPPHMQAPEPPPIQEGNSDEE